MRSLHLLHSQRFSENLYLTTGKLNIITATRAIAYMRQFVRKFRERKAAGKLLNQGSPAGAPVALAPAPTPAVGTPATASVTSMFTPKLANKANKLFELDSNPLAA